MPLFGSRRTHTVGTTSSRRRGGGLFSFRRGRPVGTSTTTSSRRRGGGLFHRRDKDRVAGGFKAALSNPNTTRSGRKHAKHELRAMGRGRETHVPFMTKVKRALGIRSTPRHTRRTHY